MLDVSVITLNYKEAALTKKCIDSLLRSKGVSYEVIVIDNSVSEKEKKILASLKNKQLKLYFMSENLGCARGYNFGIGKAQGKYILILNNDTEIRDENAFFKMVRFMQQNPTVAVLQPKIKSLTRPAYFDYAGAAGGYIDILGYPFCRGRIFNVLEKDEGQYNDIVDITWASTCAFFARKSFVKRAGLFDPIYFAYAEEVDMSLKLLGMGFRVVFFPKTEIYHKGETSWKKRRGRKTFLIHRNHLILYLKCLPLRQMIILLPFRAFLEYVSMGYYLINKSQLHIFAVFLSHITTIVLLPRILYKRWEFFQNHKKAAIFYNRSIVVDYFLRKKHYFRELGKKDFFPL